MTLLGLQVCPKGARGRPYPLYRKRPLAFFDKLTGRRGRSTSSRIQFMEFICDYVPASFCPPRTAQGPICITQSMPSNLFFYNYLAPILQCIFTFRFFAALDRIFKSIDLFYRQVCELMRQSQQELPLAARLQMN